MGSFLHSVGAFSARRHWLVIGVWLAALIGIGTAALTLSEPTDDAFSIPGTASVQTFERLGEAFPASSGATGTVVIAAPEGQTVSDPENYAAISQSVSGQGRWKNSTAIPHSAAGRCHQTRQRHLSTSSPPNTTNRMNDR